MREALSLYKGDYETSDCVLAGRMGGTTPRNFAGHGMPCPYKKQRADS
jgi:hypothetical protein